MQDRADRRVRLERLRREGRVLDDQKFMLPRRLVDDDDDEPLPDVRELVLRYGG